LYIFINSLIFWVVAYDIMPSETGHTILVTTNASDLEDGRESSTIQEETPPSDPPQQPQPQQQQAAAAAHARSTSPTPSISSPVLRIVLAQLRSLTIHIMFLCLRPPIIAQLLGTLVGLIRPLQVVFFSPTSFLSPVTVIIKIFSDASTAVTNLSMAAGLGLQIFQMSNRRHIFGGSPDGLSLRSTWVFVFTRMFVIPGALFGLIYLLCRAGMFPNDRLLQITAYMVSATPSANMCVVVPQILGNDKASGALGLLVLGQYLVAMPSLLIWLTLAFYLTKDLL
jgi:hypothetical protein